MNPAAEPPAQPRRASTSCHRHPEEAFTGFCPSCLCERLSVLDQSAANLAASSSSRKPPTAASAAIRALFKSSGGNGSYFPELRRSKSFSAAKNEVFSGVFEPQRKSCDVRGRSTLWSLFNQDDGRGTTSFCKKDTVPELETTVNGPVFESKEEEEEPETEIETENHRIENEIQIELVSEDDDEIIACEEPSVHEIVEEPDLKPMKDFTELDSKIKKPSGGRDLKEIVGSFWSAASVFSKKLQKWRQKQKLKNTRNGVVSATLPVEKPIGTQFRETQSEIADYGFGRRSCDTDPRFSLDEPRASWDGYLIGRSFPRLPTMLSVVEDVPRSDSQIPVEQPPPIQLSVENPVPGGSAQTRDYYSDTSRRRKSFERSTSIRHTAANAVAGIDELKPSTSNSIAKVSPTTIDFVRGPKLQSRDSNSNSLRDNSDRKGPAKKSRRWSIWGFIHPRGGNSVVERSLSESWPELRRDHNAFDRKVSRSYSSVSRRHSRNIKIDTIGNVNVKLDRNQSARFSRFENGLLRFNLAPGSRRNGSTAKNQSDHAQSRTRSATRL